MAIRDISGDHALEGTRRAAEPDRRMYHEMVAIEGEGIGDLPVGFNERALMHSCAWI